MLNTMLHTLVVIATVMAVGTISYYSRKAYRAFITKGEKRQVHLKRQKRVEAVKETVATAGHRINIVAWANGHRKQHIRRKRAKAVKRSVISTVTWPARKLGLVS